MILLPIIGTWMSIEGHRRLAQIIPDEVQEWWDKWELRGLILLSLLSQIILTLLGNRTKYKPNICTRPLVWSAYLLADWVAAVAMGVISSNLGDYYNKGEQPKNVDPQLLAFWAPFFLMHLGGPDTITAYALEDNELWLRHLVGLLSQTALTVYIIFMSWKGNWLSHITILMLIIGIIKYAERTWSLYCGSIKNLRDSFLRSIDSSEKSEQWQEPRASAPIDSVEDFVQGLADSIADSVTRRSRRIGNQRVFLRAIYIFISLFVDLVLGPWDINRDKKEFQAEGRFGWSVPFSTVDYELKLMYDVFYTKAFANYGILGVISRLITLTTTIVVLVSYANSNAKMEHLVEDHIITYLLLVGALIAEIYAFISASFSRWTKHYFVIKGLGLCCWLYECIDCLTFFGKGGVRISLGQSDFFNLICNKKLNIKGNFFPVNNIEELPSVSHCLTSDHLQQAIHKHLYDKSEKGSQSNASGAPGYRNLLLEKNGPIFSSELEFHRTIITWHIATDLFYYSNDESSSIFDSRKNCKEMSDYMFYLLIKQRHMLPVGAGLITLRDTIIEAMKFFEHIKVVPEKKNLAQTCTMLLQQDTVATTRDDEASSSGMQTTSVLFHACEVAKQLNAEQYKHLVWDFLEELWVEIMCYAGAQCRVDMHAHQLRRGPEFLSHIWLLQAHFGLLDQFQISSHQESV
ncbi:uncharacterized protein LOC109801983 [Cajanus cajan]|uniref:uncharacterized protein LOC109801983 n=1 Tax=Cajanus cajan TaxID=3821 RepID=UPI0010FBA3D1|nr:uncharacterized protein LOC109801983 [Cajanus cajan]XP_029127307.1 uncharacterized protein LOC109801983 [Cajanus cajan]